MRRPLIGMPRLFGVLSLALAGLMALQVMLLRYAWDLKVQALESGASTALASAVLSLQSREIEGTAFQYFFARTDSSAAASGSVPAVAPVRKPATVWTSSSSYHVQIADEPPVPPRPASGLPPAAPKVDVVRRFHEVQRGLDRLSGRRTGDGPAAGVATVASDSVLVVMSMDGRSPGEVLAYHAAPDLTLRHVVGDWINSTPRPIAERLDPAEISTVLRDELQAVGIDAEPAFGVMRSRAHPARVRFPGGADGDAADDPADADVVLASDNITDAELRGSAYRQQLFPLDPFGAPYELVLAFPQDRLWLLRQIGPLWAASALFISVIVFSFLKAWRTNAEQRRFGAQLVDFINNMTHEFKTPIATVALAGEAMARPDVQGEPDVLARYVGMIRDENARMHRQVEKILQMARFESGDLEIKREPVDVHEVLDAVAASFALQVERAGGRLEQEHGAPAAVVTGDRVHLESIFGNLVDNAVKYADGPPQVRVATAVRDGWLEVKVSDRGPGIPRADQRRVFEKYYRRPTGDRHDVKGFGLGLSFVRSLARAHGGHVELHSLEGRGTTVTVSLPPAAAAAEETP